MTIQPCFIGIDISKARLDVFDGRHRRLANRPDAIAGFLAGLDRERCFVVFEATGPYDGPLHAALAAADIRFARVNPARARAFARAAGLLAKTDAVDARMLALMGEALALSPDEPRDEARLALAALAARRDQLVAMRAAERVRLKAAADHIGSLARHLRFLDDEIAALDRALAEAVRADPGLAEADALLRSAPGVGPVTAATLAALMPELGRRGPKTIAALAGLAPVNRDSGRHRGKRSITGGRSRVRRALYMAAIAAVRSNPRFKAFYQAVLDRRAAAKIALVAVARKLLVVLNAMIKNKTAFQT
ncbi:MAG: transposase [Beijerinckiaceae bacterium]|nr:transposase [Beijerinckiaceae bacterium]